MNQWANAWLTALWQVCWWQSLWTDDLRLMTCADAATAQSSVTHTQTCNHNIITQPLLLLWLQRHVRWLCELTTCSWWLSAATAQSSVTHTQTHHHNIITQRWCCCCYDCTSWLQKILRLRLLSNQPIFPTRAGLLSRNFLKQDNF